MERMDAARRMRGEWHEHVSPRGDAAAIPDILTDEEPIGDVGDRSVRSALLHLNAGHDHILPPAAASTPQGTEEGALRLLVVEDDDNLPGQPTVLRCADVELDGSRHQVSRNGVLLTLTRKEYLVLERLMAASGMPVSHRELIDYAWDRAANPPSNVLAVVIARLRRKLRNPPLIHTVRGTGYRMGGTASG